MSPTEACTVALGLNGWQRLWVVLSALSFFGWLAGFSAYTSAKDLSAAEVPNQKITDSPILSQPGPRPKLAPEEIERLTQLSRWILNQALLRSCLDEADANYRTNWNRTCQAWGRPSGCTLPAPVVAVLDQRHIAARDECFRLYPQR